ncbi:MAG: zinc ribbon domain-containing protein [Promethearchaeota archaeon]
MQETTIEVSPSTTSATSVLLWDPITLALIMSLLIGLVILIVICVIVIRRYWGDRPKYKGETITYMTGVNSGTSSKYCPHCGAENASNSTFCVSCGEAII